MKKRDRSTNSVFGNQKFSIQDAIKSIKHLRRSELCRSGKHEWTYISKKGYEKQDYYECKQCHERKKATS